MGERKRNLRVKHTHTHTRKHGNFQAPEAPNIAQHKISYDEQSP